MASDIDDLDAVCRSVTDGPVALLGHSWGGVLAMACPTRHPAHVSHLLLMNTAPASHQDWVKFREDLSRRQSPEDRAAFATIDASDRFLAGDPDADIAHYRVHFRIAVVDPARHIDVLLARLRDGWTAKGVLRARRIEEGLYAGTAASPSFDLRPGLARLTAPTLLLHGRADFVPLRVVSRSGMPYPARCCSCSTTAATSASWSSPIEP